MASLLEVFGTSGAPWDSNEQRIQAEKEEHESLLSKFNVNLSDLQPHPRLRFTDDGCTHYLDKEGIHYWFHRRSASWERELTGEESFEHRQKIREEAKRNHKPFSFEEQRREKEASETN